MMAPGFPEAACDARLLWSIAAALAVSGCGRIGYDHNDGYWDSRRDAGFTGDGASSADADPLAPDANPLNPTNMVLAAGWNHTCAAIDGQVRCWGAGLSGQLGDGNLQSSQVPVPVSIPGTVTALTASRQHTCAIADGDAYCWGLGIHGKLGNGDEMDRPTPAPVVGLPAGQVTDIDANRFGTCAVAGGEVYCWGTNSQGQCGVNSAQSPILSPAKVANLPSPVQDLTSADDHGCAIAGSTGYCWGNGNKDELGTGGSPGWRNDPVTVVASPSQLSTGIVHSCGIVAGAVSCWGQGGNGELGNGQLNNSATAVAVQNLDQGVTKIYASSGKIMTDDIDSTCAIQDGNVLCWGRNDNGQLGDQTQVNRAAPVAVQGLDGAASELSGGLGHFCALVFPDKIQCWGLNANGQLGNGSNTSSLTPVTVTNW
jgi:alpha-tubulin suppressor-like RCC1 family protein